MTYTRCCSVKNYQQTGTLLDDFPLPFDTLLEPAALPGAGGRGGKTPAKTPARGGRRGKAAVDSPESESEEDTGPQMPQSDSDEKDGEVRAAGRATLAQVARPVFKPLTFQSDVCLRRTAQSVEHAVAASLCPT